MGVRDWSGSGGEKGVKVGGEWEGKGLGVIILGT